MQQGLAAYFDEVPQDRRPQLIGLHQLIVGLYPDAIVDLQYKMPTYRVGEGWVAIANQKRYISLYTCGAHHLEDFKAQHPHVKTGKGCINFRPSQPIPLAAVAQVVKHAMDHPKAVRQ